MISAATAARARRGNGGFDPHVLILTALSRRLNRRRKACLSLLADFKLGLAVENLDLANILLGDMASAADQGDQPLGIRIILAAGR